MQINWGYTPTGYVLTAQDREQLEDRVTVGYFKDAYDALILTAPEYHTAGDCEPKEEVDSEQ